MAKHPDWRAPGNRLETLRLLPDMLHAGQGIAEWLHPDQKTLGNRPDPAYDCWLLNYEV